MGDASSPTGSGPASCQGTDYALDAQSSDLPPRCGRIRGGVSVWPRTLAEPQRCGADGGVHRFGRTRWAYRAAEKSGDTCGRTNRHSWRSDDRERLFHVFRGSRDGVVVAAGFLFRARSRDGFSARARVESGVFRLGRCERDAANMVGTVDGRLAVEPRIVRRDEVYVFLLSRARVGADARPSGADRRAYARDAHRDSQRRRGAHFGHGGVLFCSRDSSADGRVAVHRGKCCAGGDGENGGRESFREEDGMKPVVHIDSSNAFRLREVDASRVAAFFDIDGTLLPLPSLERRFVSELRRERLIPIGNYVRWLPAAIRLVPGGLLLSVF